MPANAPGEVFGQGAPWTARVPAGQARACVSGRGYSALAFNDGAFAVPPAKGDAKRAGNPGERNGRAAPDKQLTA